MASLDDDRPSALPALTMARFGAALVVVVYHLWRFDVWDSPDVLERLIGAGPAAVSFFFVLSGFVLAWSQTASDGALLRSARAFWVRRLRRLAPMYALAAAIAVPTAAALIKKTYGEDADVRALLLPELLVHLSGIQAFVPGGELAINPPAWSLSVELFFSLLFPWLAPAALRWTPSTNTAISALVVLWLLSTAPGFMYLAVDADGLSALKIDIDHRAHAVWLDVLRYHPFVRLPELVAGVVLCGLVRRGAAPAPGLVVAALVFIVAVAAAGLPAPVTHNGLFLPAFAVIVAALAARRTAPTGALARALVLLGDASYALYLLHVPLLLWAAGLSLRRTGRNVLDDPLGAVVVVVVIVGLSVAAHALVERRRERR